MAHRFFVPKNRQWVLWVCAMIGFFALACAAPAPPQATVRELAAAQAPVLYVSEFDGAEEDILAAVAAFSGGTPVVLGHLDGMQRNFNLGVSLDEGDDALIFSSGAGFPEVVLPELLLPLLIGRSAIACVEFDNQAFWAIDQAAVQNIYASAPSQDPDVAQVLSDCSKVAEMLMIVCPNCGCGGPMGGDPPQCPTTSMQAWPPQPILATSTPTPTP